MPAQEDRRHGYELLEPARMLPRVKLQCEDKQAEVLGGAPGGGGAGGYDGLVCGTKVT